MEPSIAGLALFAILYSAGGRLGSGPLCGLMLALPFGSTAVVVLPALGGGTALRVPTLFALAVLAEALWRDAGAGRWRAVLAERTTWALLALIGVAVAGTIVLPRWFTAATTVFVPAERGFVAAPLQPSWRNLAQASTFVIDALLYLAVAARLLGRPRRALILRAFYAWAIVHTAGGLIDLAAKVAGWGDVFAPLRTAPYRTLSGAVAAGFPRLTGALPEPATFAMMTLACLAFSFVHWRGTGSRLALGLALANLLLVALSTSSTAYAGFVLLCLPVAVHLGRSLLAGRLAPADRRTAAVAAAVVAVALLVWWAAPGAAAAYLELLRTRIIDKLGSAGGLERAQFNLAALRNVVDTHGLGVGLGSSRAASWPIAVLSQLGLLGAAPMALLVLVIARGMAGVPRAAGGDALVTAGDAVCASAAAWLVAASLSAGAADPGALVFVAAAVAVAWRRHAGGSDRPAGGAE